MMLLIIFFCHVIKKELNYVTISTPLKSVPKGSCWI